MADIAIISCKKIQDHSCVACAKCYKGIDEKNAEFGRHDEIHLVAITDCGDCPGLTVPRVKLLKKVAKALDRQIDTFHVGTCVKMVMETADCPIEFEDLRTDLEKRFGVNVILDTHAYSLGAVFAP